MKILWFPRLYADIDHLHLTTWREMGGCLRKRGHEVQIALAVAGKETRPPFFPVPACRHSVLRMLSFWAAGLIVFIRRMHSYDPDVVILDVYTFWFALVPLRKRDRRVVLLDNRTPVYHVTPAVPAFVRAAMSLYLKLCYGLVRRTFSGMTVITEFYKDWLSNRYGFDPGSIGVWGSGVDTEKFSAQRHPNPRRPVGLDDKYVVLQHGELSFNRGLLESVEAMDLVRFKDIVLVLMGEGSAKPALQSLVNRLGLRDNVFLLPAVSYEDVPEIILSSDCGLMAYPDGEYWNANNPIKLLEYLACGKPVIATGLWTFRQVMADSKCAVYIKDNTPTSIARALEFCYIRRAEHPDWGREGPVLTREHYTWKIQADRLLVFIERLRNQRKRQAEKPCESS